jgi:DHA1 family bicyclomycin/chloramphenicol resistance-like MFS transporter
VNTIFILLFCFVVGHIGNYLITPSFPDIITFLHTTAKSFHYATSAFALGVSIGGFFLGPFSDSFGRKKILVSGLALNALGCIGCMLSSDVHYLVVFRFIQGIGTSAPVIICVAMIFDIYNKQDAIKVVGLKNSILTLANSLAPIAGGYLNVVFQWQINFLILAALSIMGLLLVLPYIKESSSLQKDVSLKRFQEYLKDIFKNYLFLLSDKVMVAYICILGFMACSLITYMLGASIIYINHLHVSSELYGLHPAAVWTTFGTFCFFNNCLVKYTSISCTKKIGFALMITGCVLLNIIAHYYAHPNFITASMCICSAGLALLITILFTDAMSLHTELRGASSSIIACARAFFIAVAIAIAGYFFSGTILPLTYIISILLISATMIYILVIKNLKGSKD